MKFSVEKALTSGGRLGIITCTQVGRQENLMIETPMCTLFTKGGSAPYLSLDMLQKLTGVPQVAMNESWFSVSLDNKSLQLYHYLAAHHEAVSQFGKGLGEFTALKDKLIFTTLHDASAAVATGKNDKSGVAVWGKGGKLKLDTNLFSKIQEAFQPDWIQALSDGDTDKECGPKRLGKAVDRTLDFLDEIVENIKKNENLKKGSLIGVIEGGFSEKERVRSAKETAARPVQGFLIEGFEKGNSEVDLFSYTDFSEILSKTMSNLPEDKPRIMETVWSPLQVVKAFKLGVDVFSSAYPYTLTEKGQALVADYSLPPSSQAAKLECEGSKPDEADGQGFIIDLKNKQYFDDFSPVLSDCTCYTCTNFTCSYIHHLLNTSELLAYVLLTLHNFHQYFDFFTHLRKAVKDDKLDQLEESLARQSSACLDR